MRWHRQKTAALWAGVIAADLLLTVASPAAAMALLPHRAAYALTLDGSKPTGQLEDMSGRIDYEITGDACAGYTTLTRQTSESSGGEGGPSHQAVTSKAWEAGNGDAYRFLSTTESDDDTQNVEARVSRPAPDRLNVTVTKPQDRELTLDGRILMPTEHVLRVLAAAAAGERTLAAKVYDGASDPAKVYDTLSVIGAARSGDERLAPAARAVLAGHVAYPVAVSYYEPGAVNDGPAYVMSFTLFDNGVVGDLRIDYGRFALVGSMAAFEALPASGGCEKPAEPSAGTRP